MQAYFRDQAWEERAGAAVTVTVHIPTGNLLDEAVVRRFREFRDESLATA